MSIIRDGFQSADLDVPVVLPTLNLDFANSQELDPRITFSRGSIGTFVNKNGLIETAAANVPRFDYDPISGECKGLLIEESRQNLFTYSDGFSANVPPITVTNNFATSPDGTFSATRLLGTSSGTGTYNNASATAGITYTLSVYAKRNSRSSTLQLIIYDLPSANATSQTFILTDNWQRFSITRTVGASQTSVQCRFVGFGSPFDILIWGAQLEAGSFPTSYIPTSGSTVTRSADNVSMTGTNFSSWYNQTEGTLYANAVSNANTLNNQITGVAALNDGGGSYRVDLRYHQSGNSQTFFSGIGGGGSQLSRTSGFSLTNPKFIVSYQTKYINFAVNTSLISSNTSRFVPYSGINTLRIGTFDAGNNYYLNGTIKKLTYYPKALSPAQLQYLTQ